MKFPKPFFRASKQAWYLQLGKRQISLGKDRDKAFKRYQEILLHDLGQAPIEDAHLTVAQISDLFVEWSGSHHAVETRDWYHTYLQSFCDSCGGLSVQDLKPFHVTRWLADKAWGSTTQHQAISCVKRALNWAVDEGLLTDNPLKRVRKPPMQRRERIIDETEHQTILSAVKDEAFRQFLFALRDTGARPKEIRTVSKEHVNLGDGIWVFHQHKTKGKTGRPRVIYLTPAMTQLTKELMVQHPDGTLFRNSRGRPWTRNAVRLRFRNLRKKFPQLKGVTSYVVRHTYTTDALERGVPIATVAELLGHSSTRMIEQHYSHLAEKREHLRQAAIKATEPKAS